MRNLLLLGSGSKVALARIAKRAAVKRGSAFHAADLSADVPTRHFADRFHLLDTSNWLESLQRYCREENIGLIIPARHGDLLPLSKASSRFEKESIRIAISSEDTINTCINKLETHEFLTQNGIPCPETFALDSQTPAFLESRIPFFAKPVSGSASDGARVVDRIETATSLRERGGYLGQAIADGEEYTVNLYVTRDKECISVIPHKRIAVQSGESVQAITCRIPTLIDLSMSVIANLPGAIGPLNIQIFYDREADAAQVIEINPRLGGGYPLADRAGGRFIEWMAEEYLTGRSLKPVGAWTDGLRMMRYRDAIFDRP